MIDILETNISKKKEHYIIRHRENIDSFQTDTEKSKSKSSNVDIIISKKQLKYIRQVRKYNTYLLEVHIFFKQLELIVFIVYIALNS